MGFKERKKECCLPYHDDDNSFCCLQKNKQTMVCEMQSCVSLTKPFFLAILPRFNPFFLLAALS